MTEPQHYLDAIHFALLTSPVVENYVMVRQRATPDDGYLRLRCELANGDFLEAYEYFTLSGAGVQTTGYRHQWMNGERTMLRKRWDDKPHYPHLPNFPHHCHDGDETNVIPGEPLSIIAVLQRIQAEIEANAS